MRFLFKRTFKGNTLRLRGSSGKCRDVKWVSLQTATCAEETRQLGRLHPGIRRPRDCRSRRLAVQMYLRHCICSSGQAKVYRPSKLDLFIGMAKNARLLFEHVWAYGCSICQTMLHQAAPPDCRTLGPGRTLRVAKGHAHPDGGSESRHDVARLPSLRISAVSCVEFISRAYILFAAIMWEFIACLAWCADTWEKNYVCLSCL